jgi:hypothetical protein
MWQLRSHGDLRLPVRRLTSPATRGGTAGTVREIRTWMRLRLRGELSPEYDFDREVYGSRQSLQGGRCSTGLEP